MNFDFGSNFRLNDSSRIRDVRIKGNRFKIYPFVIFRLSNDKGYPRLAIGITKKAGGSVIRNKFKRQVREFFRHMKDSLGSMDYYFFCSCSLAAIDARGLDQFKENLSRQLKIK